MKKNRFVFASMLLASFWAVRAPAEVTLDSLLAEMTDYDAVAASSPPHRPGATLGGFTKLGAAIFAAPVTSVAAGDILIADFEAKDYGDWKVEGTAFGAGPARGSLASQRGVAGFEGEGLVDTYLVDHDRPTGKLTSPEFAIVRDYITFLIGGGDYKGKTCMNLCVAGKVVRSATGRTDFLEQENWDVREFAGKKAVIEIVDAESGDWGHICVDQIRQSATRAQKKSAPPARTEKVPAAENGPEVKITGRYLIFPVSNKPQRGNLTVIVDGQLVHRLSCDFPPNKDAVDWWGWLDMSEYLGRTAQVVVDGAPPGVREMIESSDTIRNLQPLYDEALRPQFHFSQMRGWNNDVNGLFYHQGTYHFFWQCNPAGCTPSAPYWGYATSHDLVHWTEQPHAIRSGGGKVGNRHPAMADGGCWSGSGIVDTHNTAGWQQGDAQTMVLAFTDFNFGESLAYSTDRGKTWRFYEGNPVVRHRGRDPKLVWYEPGKHWVMAVYDENKEQNVSIAFYTSKDLKAWTRESIIAVYNECPELFELPVDGNPAHRKWVTFDGSANYAVGNFNGRQFTPDSLARHRDHYGSYYASQCFSGAPDGRVVQIGWAKGVEMPGMPFNQAFSLPAELTLRTTKDGIRLCACPIREIEQLRRPNPKTVRNQALTAASPAVELEARDQLYDIVVALKQGSAKRAVLAFGTDRVTYDFVARRLDEMPLEPDNGTVAFRVLVDRPMYEVVGGQGACYKTSARADQGKQLGTISLTADGGELTVESIEVHEMRSIWKDK